MRQPLHPAAPRGLRPPGPDRRPESTPGSADPPGHDAGYDRRAVKADVWPMSNTVTRHIPFDGVCNFREVGGLATRDGGVMRAGILYRSDELSQLTGEDLSRLRRLHLKTICDLRAPNERRAKPDRIPPGVRLVHVPIDHRGKDFTRWQFFWWLTTNSKKLDFRRFSTDLYRYLAFECGAQIREVVTLVADERNLPAVFHCTVGRDRTGYLAALFQLLAGVPRAAVIDDYLATNDLIGPRAEQIVRFLRWMSLFRISRRRLESAMVAHGEDLEGILDVVLERHGSIEGYLRDACGLDRQRLASLRRLLRA